MDNITTTSRFVPTESLADEGEPSNEVFNVTEGVVRLSKLLPDGRRAITGFLYPGDFLGLAFQSEYVNTAEAITNVTACRMRRKDLQSLFSELPKLEERLLSMMSNELVIAQDQMLLLGRKTPKEKLASFFLQLIRRSQSDPDNLNHIHLAMTRADIADYLGLTVETVSRTFSSLVKEGLIELASSNKVLIMDRETIADLAGVYEDGA